MNRIKMKKSICVIFLILTIAISFNAPKVTGWKQKSSYDFTHPYFTTHQWLAQEALKLFSSPSMIQWITNNQLSFWLGVEAPYNSFAASEYDTNYEVNYGDIDDLFLYLDITGITVTESNLSERAQLEYDRLVGELEKDNPNEEQAAFYAGAMSHYVSQAGFWGAIWNGSLWGSLSIDNSNNFQNFIDNTLNLGYYNELNTIWESNYYSLLPSIISPMNASAATIALTKNVHILAKELGDNYDEFSNSVFDWSTEYNNNVTFCLTYSVEAIYSALKSAMEKVNWKYLSIGTPIFEINTSNIHLTIPEFSVNYTDNSGSHILTNSIATIAQYRVIVDPENEPILQPEIKSLQYNLSSNKWYLPEHLLKGCIANTEHSIKYQFKMNGSVLTWSNTSDIIFDITFFSADINNYIVHYNSLSRTLDIWNITCYIPLIPEIGFINASEVSSAKWILYTRGEGSYESQGIPAVNTIGEEVSGNLLFDPVNNFWYSYENDIGLVFTATLQLYYVIIRFEIAEIPVGLLKTTPYGSVYYPYTQKSDDDVFETRAHEITVSKPRIVYNEEAGLISAYDITAYSDYKNTLIDNYEIHIKTIYGQDRRSARCKIFLEGGIASSITNDLEWDTLEHYWYIENIDISSLPEGRYYLSARFSTMNSNYSTSTYGPASDFFVINSGPLPTYIYLLPALFIVGIVGIPVTLLLLITFTRKK